MDANYTSLAMFAIAMVSGPGPANMILLTIGLKYGVRRSVSFLIGVIFSKQLIIWPVGFSLMTLSVYLPNLFLILKYLSIIYIIWLSWRVLFINLNGAAVSEPPKFFAGLLVHPFNPKAWLMVTASFSSFGNAELSALYQTGVIAGIFFLTQCLFHFVWLTLGSKVSILLDKTNYKNIFIYSISFLTLLSVLSLLYSS